MHRKTIGGYFEDIVGSPEMRTIANQLSHVHRYIPPETVQIEPELTQTAEQGEEYGTSN